MDWKNLNVAVWCSHEYPKLSIESFGSIYALRMQGSMEQIRNQYYAIANHGNFNGCLYELGQDFYIWITKNKLVKAFKGQLIFYFHQQLDQKNKVELGDSKYDISLEEISSILAEQKFLELKERQENFIPREYISLDNYRVLDKTHDEPDTLSEIKTDED